MTDDILDGRLLQPKSPHRSRFVASQLTDDFLQRLINCIEEPCAVDAETAAALDRCVQESVRGDDYLAYQEIKTMFREEYPGIYADEDGE